MRTQRLCLTVLVALCALGIGAGSASAGTGYGPFSTFGEFSAPAGVAVDGSGSVSKEDVYVVDIGNQRVVKFHPNALEPGKLEQVGELTGFAEPVYVAVDPNNGDVFVADLGAHVVDEFSAAGVALASIAPEGEFFPTGVAINPITGHLYVGEQGAGHSQIDEFEEESPGKWKLGNQFGTGEVSVVDSIAIDGEGHVFVTSQSRAIEEFSASGVPVVCPSGKPFAGTNVVDNSTPQSVAIDPSNNEIFVGEGFSSPGFKIAAYSSPCSSPVLTFGGGDFGEGGSYGLAVSGVTHALYGSLIGSTVADAFLPGPTATEPKTTGSKPEPNLTATLEGELLGGETGYYFAYNTDGSCSGGGTTPVESAAGTANVSAQISGLEPSTIYTFCIVATSEFGSTPGAALTLETEGGPPQEVSTGPATEVTETSAKLNGSLNPNHKAVYYFEYGTAPCTTTPTPSCGTKTATQGPLKGETLQSVTGQEVSGLTPGVTYHYWVVASNSKGTVYGQEETLKPSRRGPPRGSRRTRRAL